MLTDIASNKREMIIKNYEFGKIRINGNSYTHDIVINGSGRIDHWLRRTGHNVEISDVGPFIHDAKVVIIGTGGSGMMKVPPETIEFIEGKGIKLIIEKTPEAVKAFNKKRSENSVGMFHLTC